VKKIFFLVLFLLVFAACSSYEQGDEYIEYEADTYEDISHEIQYSDNIDPKIIISEGEMIIGELLMVARGHPHIVWNSVNAVIISTTEKRDHFLFPDVELYFIRDSVAYPFMARNINDNFFLMPIIRGHNLIFEDYYGWVEGDDFFKAQQILKLATELTDVRNVNEEIVIRDGEIPLHFNFFVRNNFLIILEAWFSEDESSFVYEVIKFNMDNSQEDIVMQTSFDIIAMSGGVIVDIFVSEDSIFSYQLKNTSSEIQTHLIYEHDLNGNALNVFQLDLDDFLLMNVGDLDHIVSMYKISDYIILQTRHNRVIMFQVNEGVMNKIDVPSSLQVMNTTRFVEHIDEGSDLIYFWNARFVGFDAQGRAALDEHLYIYCIQQQKFFRIPIKVALEDEFFERFYYPFLDNIIRDPEGNLYFQIASNMGAYNEDRERRRREVEASDGFWTGGASSVMPNHRIVFRITADEIREVKAALQ